MCLFAKGTFAEVYTSAEYGFSVDIPGDYIVLSEDTESDSPVLLLTGMTKDDLNKMLGENGYYLCGFRLKDKSQINISVERIGRTDKGAVSRTQVDYMYEYLLGEYEKSAKEITKSELYTHPKLRLVAIHLTDKEHNTSGIKYHAIYDDILLAVSVEANSARTTKEHERIIKKVIDSMDFPSLAELSDSYEKTAPINYSDGAGTSFTVPENWRITEEKNEKFTKSVSFTSTVDTGVAMAYVSTDTWEGLPFYVKLVSANEANTSTQLTDKEVAELLGISENQVGSAEYNGVLYNKAVYTETAGNMGVKIPIPITVLLRVEKGIIHTFQFLGAEDNELFGEFESLIRSINYPETADPLPERNFYMRLARIIPLTAAGLAVAALAVIAVIMVRKNKL